MTLSPYVHKWLISLPAEPFHFHFTLNKMCINMSNALNCLSTSILKASVSLESRKPGFTKTKAQNAGKLLFHLHLVIRKVEVCLSSSSCLLSGLKLSELRNLQFSSLTRKPNIIVLLTHACMSWDAHMGKTHADQGLCDTAMWIPTRTNVRFTEEQAIFAYVHHLGFFTLFFCVSIARIFLDLLNH